MADDASHSQHSGDNSQNPAQTDAQQNNSAEGAGLDFVVDLNEFATALRTFPESILKLTIYKMVEEKKAKQGEDDATALPNENNNSKHTDEDQFTPHTHFPITTEHVSVKEQLLPSFLRHTNEYDNPWAKLENHYKYSFSYLLNGSLRQLLSKSQFQKAELQEELEYRATLNLVKKAATPTLPLGAFAEQLKKHVSKAQLNAAHASLPQTGTPPTVGMFQSAPPTTVLTMLADDTTTTTTTDNPRSSIRARSTDVEGDPYEDVSEESIVDVSQRVMSLFDPYWKYINVEDELCSRKRLPIPYKPKDETKLLLNFQNLKLDAGRLEPLYCHFTIFDVAKKERVSETFTFTMNTSKEVLDPLGITKRPEFLKGEEEHRKAVFSIERNPNLYMVLLVEKVVQPGIGVEPYLKKAATTANAKSSVLSKLKEAWSFLENFRQSVMWAYEPLFDIQGSANMSGTIKMKKTPTSALSVETKDNTRSSIGSAKEPQQAELDIKLRTGLITFKELFPISTTDAKNAKLDFCEVITHPEDYKKKIKPVGGYFLLEVEEVKEEALEKMLPQDKLPKLDKPKALRTPVEEQSDFYYMLRNFHQVGSTSNDYVSPFVMHYNHSLYIHPDSCSFGSMGLKDCKNILVRATLRECDDLTSQSCLKEFVAPWSRNFPDGLLKVKHALSTITYKEKYPQFFDEFRIDLPVPLSKGHHLLFEFFHVNYTKPTKPVKGDDDPELSLGKVDKTFIGYSVLKLADGESWRDGAGALEVYKSLSPGYLEKLSNFETYLQGKQMFKFSASIRSSLYPQDDKAHAFIRSSVHLLESKASNLSSFFGKMLLPRACATMEALKQAKSEKLLSHFPALVNMLLYVMANMKGGSDQDSSQDEVYGRYLNAAFETLLSVIRGCYKEVHKANKINFKRDDLIQGFIQHIFINPDSCHKPMYLTIAELWDAFINNCQRKERESQLSSLTSEPSSTDPNSRNRSGTIRRKLTLLGKKAPAAQAAPTAESAEEQLTVKDSLQFSWFFFDLMVKSMMLYIKTAKAPETKPEKKEKPTNDSKDKQDDENDDEDDDDDDVDEDDGADSGDEDVEITSKHIGEDEQFFTAMRSLQRKIVEQLIDLYNDTSLNQTWVRRVNHDLALFLRDMLTIAFMPDIAKHNTFRFFVYHMLDDYILTTEIKKSSSIARMRLDFLNVFCDHDDIIEYSVSTRKKYIITYILDMLAKCLLDSDANNRIMAIDILQNMLTKLDYSKKYQSPEQRNEIAKVLFPFVQRAMEEEDILKNLGKPELQRLLIIILHILRNRKREEMKTWWRTKTGFKPASLLHSFLSLMSNIQQCFLDYPVKIIRKTVKFTCLDIFNLFVADAKTIIMEDAQYTPLLDKLMAFMVNFLDGDNKDPEYREKLYFPSLFTFLNTFITKLSQNENDPRWKECIGCMLRFVEFPIKNNTNQTLINIFTILLQPFEAKAKEISVEPFKIIPDSEDNVILDDKGNIKGATLDKLVEKITSDQDLNPKFPQIFFLTYRSFTKPFNLLEKLIQRFRMSLEVDPDGGDKVTLRVVNAIKMWIDKHFYDLNCILITKLIIFLDTEVAYATKIQTFCKNVKKSLHLKLSGEERQTNIMFSKQAPKTVIPKNFNKYVQFNLLDWSALELARQLTLIEYEYFKKIEPKECLSGGAWAKDKKYLLAPNIAGLTDRWNLMTQWVAQTILTAKEMKQRKAIMVRIIEVADALRVLNNFNGVTEIVSGLNNSSVFRLKKTWEALPDASRNLFQELHNICDQQSANKNMRDCLSKAAPPCIPPLSMYLKDLIFIDDGNPNIIRNELINVFKRTLLSKIIMDIRGFQQTPYHLERIPYVQEFLLNKLFPVKMMTDDELWDLSLEVEPREKT